VHNPLKYLRLFVFPLLTFYLLSCATVEKSGYAADSLWQDEFDSPNLNTDWHLVDYGPSGNIPFLDYEMVNGCFRVNNTFTNWPPPWQRNDGFLDFYRTFKGNEWMVEIKVHYNWAELYNTSIREFDYSFDGKDVLDGHIDWSSLIYVGTADDPIDFTWTEGSGAISFYDSLVENYYYSHDSFRTTYLAWLCGPSPYQPGANSNIPHSMDMTRWFRWIRTESFFSIWYSSDGQNWTLARSTPIPAPLTENNIVVLYTHGGPSVPGAYVEYDYVRITKLYDLSIKDVKVIQVSEGLPLVAKKKTMVRVDVDLSTVDPSLTESPEPVTVQLEWGGKTYKKTQIIKKYDLTVKSDADAVAECKDAFIFTALDIPSEPSYTFDVTVDPDLELPEIDETNNVWHDVATLLPVRPYKILYIPIKVNGTAPTLQGMTAQEDLLTAIFPIVNNYRYHKYSRDFYDLWKQDKEVPPNPPALTPETQLRMFERLQLWGQHYNDENPKNRADRFVGYVPAQTLLDENGKPTFGGLYWPVRAAFNAVLVDLTVNTSSLAHELGHSHGLCLTAEDYETFEPFGSEVTGVPPANRFTIYNTFMQGTHAPGSFPALPGSLAAQCLLGFDYNYSGTNPPFIIEIVTDPSGQTYRTYKTNRPLETYPEYYQYSFMGCPMALENCWIQNEDFRKLLTGYFQCPTDPAVLLVTGVISTGNTLTLKSCYYAEEGYPDAPTPGEYAIESLDSADTLINRITFASPSWFTEAGSFLFSYFIPCPPETQKIVFKYGDTVLKEIAKSPNPPSVNITAQSEESGTQTLTWASYDPDGDDLCFTVSYGYADGTKWLPLALDIPRDPSGYNTLSIDPRSLPGSPRALLKITATDNFHTVETLSAPFEVAQQPPVLEITYPAPGSVYTPGSTVAGNGIAHDPEDGDLSESVAWSSDIDGPLGTGVPFEYSGLSLGAHLLTASVTDSSGETASVNIPVTVTENPQPDASIVSLDTTPLTAGSEAQVTATVFSRWFTTACDVSFYVDGSLAATKAQLSCAPNTTTPVTFLWTPQEARAYAFRVEISNITPADEILNNNSLSQTFVCVAGTTLLKTFEIDRADLRQDKKGTRITMTGLLTLPDGVSEQDLSGAAELSLEIISPDGSQQIGTAEIELKKIGTTVWLGKNASGPSLALDKLMLRWQKGKDGKMSAAFYVRGTAATLLAKNQETVPVTLRLALQPKKAGLSAITGVCGQLCVQKNRLRWTWPAKEEFAEIKELPML
jgi:hypothetical protein